MEILIAWEIGGNFGHLTRDIPIARRLRDRGHNVIFVCTYLEIAAQMLSPEGFEFFQAPLALLGPDPLRHGAPISHSDLLCSMWGRKDYFLLGMTYGWLALFNAKRPKVIVADYAPTAILAARIANLPVVLVGTGWEIPPVVSPMPSIGEEPVSKSLLDDADRNALTSINSVLAHFGRGPMRRVSDLYSKHPIALTSFPELDQYWPRLGANYVGHFSSDIGGVAPQWPTANGNRVIAYLRSFIPELNPLLAALAEIDSAVLCVLPDCTHEHRAKENDNLTIYEEIALGSALPGADLVVTYGGAGTVANALLAGVPTLLVGTNSNERGRTAMRVESLGAGVWLRTIEEKNTYLRVIHGMLLPNAPHRAKARAFRDKYRSFNADLAIERVAELICSCLA